MRLLIALLLALASACAADPHHAAAPSHVAHHPWLTVGAPVAARWQDGRWYFGHITDVDGARGRYVIDYADGDEGTVGPGQILPIAAPYQVVIGARVLALWKGASMYPGTVIQVTVGLARIRWDDGDLPIDVPLDRVAVIGEER